MGGLSSTLWGRRVCIQGFGGKPEGKRPLGRPGRRWEDNIKMDLRYIEWSDMDWINLAQDKDQKRDLVKMVMNLRVPQNIGEFLSR
jgi:hypothetical protein